MQNPSMTNRDGRFNSPYILREYGWLVKVCQ